MQTFPDKSRVAFFGDSITSSGGAMLRVAAQYRADFPERDIRFFNVGISGGGFAAADLFFEGWLACVRPTHVVLAFGVNDSSPLRVTPSAPDAGAEAARVREAAGAFRAHYSALVGRVEALGAKVAVRAITPYDETEREDAVPVTKGNGDAFRRAAEQIRAVAAERGTPLVDDDADLSALLASGERLFNPDRVHPNDNGQWHLAKSFLALQGLGIAPYRPRPETAEAAGLAEWDELSSRLSLLLSTEWLVVRDETLAPDAKIEKVRNWLATTGCKPDANPYIVGIAREYLRDKPLETTFRAKLGW